MSRKTAPPTLRIEYLPLDQLARWPGNPKEHAQAAIDASITRFGFRDPLAIDERTGRLVAGHGRLGVLEQAHAQGRPAPQFVQVREDGMWLIPVTRGGAFASEDEASAYLVAHNRTGELGGWDDGLLSALLSPLDADLLAVTGFDLDAFVQETAAADPGLPPAPSEFLNDLIGPGPAPTAATPAAPAPAPAPQAAPTISTPVAPGEEPYLQVVYVVRKSERDQVLEAVKKARAQFGLETAPEAFMAIIRQYLGAGA